jgi:hypothetical protein
LKIFITTPSFGRHGGIRIIMEWAVRLSAWHDVYLHSLKGDRPEWYELPNNVRLCGSSMKGMDCLIITSPHAIDFQYRPDRPDKVFIFMQMVEHYFRPGDRAFEKKCFEFYTSPFPMFHGSRWGYAYCREAGRQGKEHYIPNGINLAHFPFSYKPKDNKYVLVEGWEASNPAKDVDHIAPKVAARLKRKGFEILAYGARPLKTMAGVPTEYYCCPSLATINKLYERATILLKATKFDARALAPIEAGTKGTVTCRAIMAGDDDLIDGVNCEKNRYIEEELYNSAIRLLGDPGLRFELANNMHNHILMVNQWDPIIMEINEILCA